MSLSFLKPAILQWYYITWTTEWFLCPLSEHSHNMIFFALPSSPQDTILWYKSTETILESNTSSLGGQKHWIGEAAASCRVDSVTSWYSSQLTHTTTSWSKELIIVKQTLCRNSVSYFMEQKPLYVLLFYERINSSVSSFTLCRWLTSSSVRAASKCIFTKP